MSETVHVRLSEGESYYPYACICQVARLYRQLGYELEDLAHTVHAGLTCKDCLK